WSGGDGRFVGQRRDGAPPPLRFRRRPIVERGPQRALDRRRVERVLELLASAPRGAATRAVLVAGDEVIARVLRIGKVARAARVGMQERRRLHPVLVRRVDLDAERAGIRTLTAAVAAVR